MKKPVRSVAGSVSLKPEEGLDALSLQRLADDFAPLDELADHLASRVMRYLLHGADGNVLADLAALKQAGQKLRLYGSSPPARRPVRRRPGEGGSLGRGGSATVALAEGVSPRSRFFQSVQCSAPPFFVRLGRVYEAASRPLRVRMARAFGDPDLDWLQILLIEATQLTLNTWPRRCRPCAILTSDLIEAMLQAEGQPRDLLVGAAFLPPRPARTRFGPELEPVWECLPGLGASAGRHPAAVLAALGQSNFKKQLQALHLMKKCRVPPAAFLGKLFELALGPRQRVSSQAALLLAEAQTGAGPFLREKTARGTSAERACAARILWRAEGGKARAFLAARLQAEKTREKKSKKVLRALEELLAAGPPEPCPDEIMAPELPSWWKQALGPKAGRPARLGTATAIAPLLAALKKEKNEATRSAMMTSLAQLGVPPEQFLDRAGLLEESSRILAREIPELIWFPFHRLPPVHWADNGSLVEPEIVRCWLAQCCKRESPEPGPLLRQYAANLKASGREALGHFVLEAWISQDTKPGESTATIDAKDSPKVLLTHHSITPLSAIAPPGGATEEPLHPAAGSAIACKGILALAGACAAAGAAPLVQRYLEQWYGRRAAQCRALLQMLAWVEHPAAAQLLLAVARGFRTPSIQEEAARQAESLVGRKRCTVAELESVFKQEPARNSIKSL